jgi:hypothetical protein
VNHSDNQERIFVRGVGDEVFAAGLETEFPGGEIRAPYSLMGKGSQATKGEENAFLTRLAAGGLSFAMNAQMPAMPAAASG